MSRYKVTIEVTRLHEMEIEADDPQQARDKLERYPDDILAAPVVATTISDPLDWNVLDLGPMEVIMKGIAALQKAANLIHKLGLEGEKESDEILQALGDVRELGDLNSLV